MTRVSFSGSDGNSAIKGTDERTPLLRSGEPVAEPIEEAPKMDQNAASDDSAGDEEEDVPLPLVQIFALCYTRLVEPIAFFCIFPYINKMIEDTGIEVEDVGFYSGLIESLFSLTQMCVMLAWGKAADRFGRKPPLVFSLCGVTIATALFGLSKSIWQMILFRCLAGIFSGTVVTVRTMLSESSTKRTQAQAFSYFALAGNVGIFIGPFLGGALESPAKKFPSIFGQVQLFREYPYALPGFVCAAVGASAAVIAAIFVKETLHVDKDKQSSSEPTMSLWDLFRYPGVGMVIFINQHILLLAFAYTAVMPVYLFTPVELGGLGASPNVIALVMGIGGLAQALWLIVVFPPLQRRIGSGGVVRACAFAWPIFFAVWPLCNLMLRKHLIAVVWVVGSVNVIGGCGVAMAFTAGQLAVNDIAPSHETLGTLNALVLAMNSGLRAFAPAVSTSIYATGVKLNILGGELFWLILAILAAGLNISVKFFPEKAEGKLKKRPSSRA